jgi:hypothetical protein
MLEFMPKRAVCAEVGIWTGEFSAHILQATQSATLHLIDIEKEWIDRAAQSFRQRSSTDRCGFISAIPPPFCPLCPRLISTGRGVTRASAVQERARASSVLFDATLFGDGKRPGAIRDAGRESIGGLATPRWQKRFRLPLLQNTKV